MHPIPRRETGAVKKLIDLKLESLSTREKQILYDALYEQEFRDARQGAIRKVSEHFNFCLIPGRRSCTPLLLCGCSPGERLYALQTLYPQCGDRAICGRKFGVSEAPHPQRRRRHSPGDRAAAEGGWDMASVGSVPIGQHPGPEICGHLGLMGRMVRRGSFWLVISLR